MPPKWPRWRSGASAIARSSSSPPDALRVAFLTPCYWPEVRRGGERLVHELATGLAARGHRARLITAHRGRPSRTTEDGVEVIRHWRPPDRRLRRRRLEDHLSHVAMSYVTLAAGDDDVAQALYARLGSEERLIGRRQQAVHVVRVLRIRGDAKAGAQPQRIA